MLLTSIGGLTIIDVVKSHLQAIVIVTPAAVVVDCCFDPIDHAFLSTANLQWGESFEQKTNFHLQLTVNVA